MLAGGEHLGSFHARVGDHRPQCRASGRRTIVRRHEETPADMLAGARNLLDEMSAAVDDDMANRFLENMIFEGDAPAVGAYDLDETQSHDGRAPFTQATNDPHDAFMQDQAGLDGFPLDHEFPKDYNFEEEDNDMDIDGEHLFEEEQLLPGRSRSARASGQRHTRWPRTSSFVIVGGALGKTRRSARRS
ncbi:hypothetical protein D1007_30590 [Hordeum vulgare]|nr:hypothetical protein D1007_30590 [Hordeum vulgare]